MSYFNDLNSAITTRLYGGTALISELGGTLIHNGYAPESAPLPYVVWSYQAASQDNITPSESSQVLLFVRAYANTAKKAGQIDDKISNLMKNALSVGSWTNFWLAREEEFLLPEKDEKTGVTTWMCGAYYRIRLDK